MSPAGSARRLCAICALFLASGGVARAQEQEAAPAEEATQLLPPADAPLVPWADAHAWEGTGLRRGVVALAVSGRALLAMGEDGAIYRQEVGGLWRVVVAGQLGGEELDEEALLLEAETAVEEFSEATDAEEVEETTDVETVEPAPEPELDTESAIEAGIQDTEQAAGQGTDAPPPHALWAAPEGGLALASTPAGAWRSTDGGRTWQPAPGLPPARDFLAAGQVNVLLAATDDGAWFSVDSGRTWLQATADLSGVRLYGLATDGAIIYAASDEGVWQSLDGLRWAKLLPPRYADVPFYAIETDPAWNGGIWAATAEGILRSDDAGQTFRPAGRNPLLGTRRLLVLPDAPGHLLAAGDEGVWESTDSGVRWRALADGLSGPQIAALALGDAPLIGTPAGALTLGRPPTEADREPATHPVGLSVEETVSIALRRGGVDMQPLLIQRRILSTTLVPKLVVLGEYQRDRSISADYDALSSSLTDAAHWKVRVELCFGSCGWSGTTYDYDITDVADLEDMGMDVEALDLAVIDGEVYGGDTGAIAPAAANVAERISRYRGDLVDLVIELYYTRQRLVQREGGLAGAPLVEQTLHAIELQEVDARLDIYTDGTFSRALRGPEEP